MSLKIVFEGQSTTPDVRLAGAVTTLGRAVGNDITISDPKISSRHGRFVLTAGSYHYEDLGSRNGSLHERDGERTVLAPNQRVELQSDDALLLGDLVSPVVLRIQTVSLHPVIVEEATVIASRALFDVGLSQPQRPDPEHLKDLFELLHELSGLVEPDRVMKRIGDAVLARFEQADSVSVLLPDAAGEWVIEQSFQRSATTDLLAPSRTLIRRVVDSCEVVSYVPGKDVGSESLAGVAGVVLVPLLVGNEAIGVLHVHSTARPFTDDALSWLAVLGTHIAASLAAARRFRALARSEAELRLENSALKGTANLARPIVGESAPLMGALKQLEKVGRTSTTVLVLGETGTGKELAARYLHAHSKRADETFAPINCGALPEELLNSELFGHRKGAFTGADRDRKGLFEAASGGTIFLDEIGEISPAVQVRLLRVLQEREVQPVGAHTPVQVDVRIVAATNRDLLEEVREGRFREDLYYRLAVFTVTLPPLRDRGRDVEILAERFRELSCARHDSWVGGFSADAMHTLRNYHWPGNVRQLEHEIERAVIMADEGESIQRSDLSDAVVGDRVIPETGSVLPVGQLKEVMGILEERVIRRSLDENGGNRTRTAEILGISRQALQTKLAKWKMRDDSV